MRRVSLAIFVLILGGQLSCDDEATNPILPPTGNTDSAQLRVVHTIATVPAVDVLVGDSVVLTAVPSGETSAFTPVPAGNQMVSFRAVTSTIPFPGTALSFAVDDSVTVLTVDSSSVINPWVLTDSGAVVPAGRSKLRAVHFATDAPAIDIWRTQPDFQTFITIMFPFRYQEVSPYLESDPGDWTVLVTTERRDSAGMPVRGDSLLQLPPVAIPDGESRTVMILDRPGGGLRATIIVP